MDDATDSSPGGRKADLTSLIRDVANEEITERFNGIGIDDSTFEAKQRTIANNRLINQLREDRDARQLAMKRSVRSIATSLIGNATWALALAGVVWLWNAWISGHLAGIFK